MLDKFVKDYSITGHTSGIGKAIFKKLSPNAIGFSKSTGFDIKNKKDLIQVLDKSENCKVFINNAYDDFAQSNLLIEAFFRWKDTNKTIINVGSQIAEDNCNVKLHPDVKLLRYQMHKASLKKLCQDLNNYGSKIKIKYVWFGYVATEKILDKYPNMPKQMLISVDEAANKIINSINID